MVFRILVPPKIGAFLWRIVNQALPSRVNLACRHMAVIPRCCRCNEPNDTSFHALFLCKVEKATWKLLGSWNVLKSLQYGFIANCLMTIFWIIHKEEFCLFSVILCLWNDKNTIFHGGSDQDPLSILEHAQQIFLLNFETLKTHNLSLLLVGLGAHKGSPTPPEPPQGIEYRYFY